MTLNYAMIFLDMTSIAQATKTNLHTRDDTRLKNFCTVKEMTNCKGIL